jgi:broad specificity phosphatase PhoE
MLIRHGDTDWNVKEIFRGRVDVDLNETGIKQAQLLSKYLKDAPIGAIYSSPLKRALKTAEIISGPHNISVKLTFPPKTVIPGIRVLRYNKTTEEDSSWYARSTPRNRSLPCSGRERQEPKLATCAASTV